MEFPNTEEMKSGVFYLTEEAYDWFKKEYARLYDYFVYILTSLDGKKYVGYGSSYSALAGQASYNDWLGKLMDVLPELEKTAYGRWTDKGDELARIFDLTNKRYQNHYDAYKDNMERAGDYYDSMWDNYNTARSMALTADKQLLNNYQINQDTFTANADRKLKADMANQGARFDTESFNAKSAQQAWADQLKLLQYQLQYAYT